LKRPRSDGCTARRLFLDSVSRIQQNLCSTRGWIGSRTGEIQKDFVVPNPRPGLDDPKASVLNGRLRVQKWTFSVLDWAH